MTQQKCDASEKGIEAALLQDGQPIALTDAETRYVQIEKEMLVAMYAFEKVNQYTYGRPLTVESDHKPLQLIMMKPLRHAPKQLQGMLLRVQKYDIEVIYKPGPQMYLADTRSKANLSNTENTQEEFEQVTAIHFLPMSEARHEQSRDTRTQMQFCSN